MANEETRELTVKLSLPTEDWVKLEKYAEDDGKSIHEYLDWYLSRGVATALREGYIYDAFRNKSDFQLAEAESCTTECPRYAKGNCPYGFLEKKFCPRIKAALKTK